MALADRQQFGDIRRRPARATGQRQQQLLADSAGRADGRAGRHSRLRCYLELRLQCWLGLGRRRTAEQK
jgi:hypothetical protein